MSGMPGRSGGRRTGAGRKPKNIVYAGQIDQANEQILPKLPDLIAGLIRVATEGSTRTEERWVLAGTLTTEAEVPELDKDGCPTGRTRCVTRPLLPGLPPDQLVCVSRKTIHADCDRRAAAYLIDRILGTPVREEDPEPEQIQYRKLRDAVYDAIYDLDKDVRAKIVDTLTAIDLSRYARADADQPAAAPPAQPADVGPAVAPPAQPAGTGPAVAPPAQPADVGPAEPAGPAHPVGPVGTVGPAGPAEPADPVGPVLAPVPSPLPEPSDRPQQPEALSPAEQPEHDSSSSSRPDRCADPSPAEQPEALDDQDRRSVERAAAIARRAPEAAEPEAPEPGSWKQRIDRTYRPPIRPSRYVVGSAPVLPDRHGIVR